MDQQPVAKEETIQAVTTEDENTGIELPFSFEQIEIGNYCPRCIIEGLQETTMPHLLIKVYNLPDQSERYRQMWTVIYPDDTKESFVSHTNLPVKDLIPIDFNPADKSHSFYCTFDDSSLK